jgi:hypothetical protein
MAWSSASAARARIRTSKAVLMEAVTLAASDEFPGVLSLWIE